MTHRIREVFEYMLIIFLFYTRYSALELSTIEPHITYDECVYEGDCRKALCRDESLMIDLDNG